MLYEVITPRRVRRGDRPVLLHPRAGTASPVGETGVGGERAGVAAGRRHPFLLLLGRAPVHRVRDLGGPPRGDLLLPRLRSDGQRGRPSPPHRTVRLEDRRLLS